jgi:UDP-N-acetylglucosamine--N-acetylmuramyl-(pentapeptide) pyrophosphoryl-undecaprenol N-acetylglucosamine transferase
VFAGGGSSGHTLPSLRVADAMRAEGHEVFFVGSGNSIEQKLCEHFDIPFYAVTTGKYDRSRNVTVLTAGFKTLRGVWEACALMRRLKPSGLFSTGGFASVPVVVAARLSGVRRILVHACDLSIGLGNRLSLPFAHRLTCTFTETAKNYGSKALFVGPVVATELYGAPLERKNPKRRLVVYGGGQGSVVINDTLRSSLDRLLARYDILHACGTGKLDQAFEGIVGYEQREYVMDLVAHIRLADLAICRAGSNSLWELVLSGTPHLAVPLPLSVSRGDQVENCKYFEKLGATRWLDQEAFETADLSATLQKIEDDTDEIRAAMASTRPKRPAVDAIQQALTE